MNYNNYCDNYISFDESWMWEYSHENSIETPLLSDISNIGVNTSLEYPTLLFTNITNNETHRGIIGISKEIHITSGKQLQFETNSKVFLLNDVDLIVDEGATLIIEDNITINGNASNQIIINGNISLGQNVTFNLGGGNMIFNNTNASITFDNSTFNTGQVISYANSMNISESNINNCYFVTHRGFVIINSSTFDGVWSYFTNTSYPMPFYSLTITNSIFKNGPYAGLTIYQYYK